MELTSPGSRAALERVRSALEFSRRALGVDVIYLSRFVDGLQHLRVVAGSHPDLDLKEGSSSALESSYCWGVRSGAIPQVIPDSAAEPRVAHLPGHLAGGIGGYVGYPVRIPGGGTYGTLCCVTAAADPSLGPHQLDALDYLAGAIGPELTAIELEIAQSEGATETFSTLLQHRGLLPVFQPIVDLESEQTVAFEALTRFTVKPEHAPDWWFGVADRLGLRHRLELVALQSALAASVELPPGVRLSVNASPTALLDEQFCAALESVARRPLIVEITEHAVVEDYEELAPVLHRLRARGIAVAVDDAGSGFASFRHVIAVAPDLIKLDMSLTRHVDADRGRRAFIAALVRFARDTGAQLVAEGVETEAELQALRQLGVDLAQGYLLGRPAPAGQLQHASSARRSA